MNKAKGVGQLNQKDNGFKFPVENFPFSASPTPGSAPFTLIERETVGIPKNLPASRGAAVSKRIADAVIGNFWSDMGWCSLSSTMQTYSRHPHAASYADAALKNRERIAVERVRRRSSEAEIERRELDRLHSLAAFDLSKAIGA